MDVKEAAAIYAESKIDEESTPAKVELICDAYSVLGIFRKVGEYPNSEYGMTDTYRAHMTGQHGKAGDLHVNEEGHLREQRLVPADCFACADQWGFVERWLEDHS